jgi:hypothetical protein
MLQELNSSINRKLKDAINNFFVNFILLQIYINLYSTTKWQKGIALP